MTETVDMSIAIVDYGLGNLFSIKQACRFVGLNAVVTSSRRGIEAADAVFLPGVGAFGDAMRALQRLDLVGLLRDQAAAGKPLIGVCLGLQLLMTESEEFGRHQGLGVIPGQVIRFQSPRGEKGPLKIPQVGWNTISRARPADNSGDPWLETPLQNIADGAYMYFVHSYYVLPDDPSAVASETLYGDIRFCSSVLRGNIFASQFHPERSGPEGLRIYRNISSWIRSRLQNNS